MKTKRKDIQITVYTDAEGLERIMNLPQLSLESAGSMEVDLTQNDTAGIAIHVPLDAVSDCDMSFPCPEAVLDLDKLFYSEDV